MSEVDTARTQVEKIVPKAFHPQLFLLACSGAIATYWSAKHQRWNERRFTLLHKVVMGELIALEDWERDDQRWVVRVRQQTLANIVPCNLHALRWTLRDLETVGLIKRCASDSGGETYYVLIPPVVSWSDGKPNGARGLRGGGSSPARPLTDVSALPSAPPVVLELPGARPPARPGAPGDYPGRAPQRAGGSSPARSSNEVKFQVLDPSLKPTAAPTAEGVAAAVGGQSDGAEERRGWLRRYLLTRPPWLPYGKPWIDDDAADELSRLPISNERLEQVGDATRRSLARLDNPAGFVISKLRERPQ